jgi:hypothetical protein
MTLEHRASRVVDQRPDIVHARLLELAARLRDELPPVEPGTQAATALGISGRVPLEIDDHGPSRIELRTTDGRIRGDGAVDLVPTADGRTTVTVSVAIRPQGFAANMILGVALRTMPNVEQQVIDGLEANLDSVGFEIAKPDSEWNPAAWQPVGLAASS